MATPSPFTRRTFLATSLTAVMYSRVLGANDRVGLGVIGCGSRGRYDFNHLRAHGAEVVSLCDPDARQIVIAQKTLPAEVAAHKDFRTLLDQKAIDAVLVATPDHWHALPAVMACHAGKDVYLEKPTAYSIAESRAIVTAAVKSKRIVQLGTQQRSSSHFQEAVARIHQGELGTVSRVRFWNVWNNTLKTGGGRSGGIGTPPDGPVPDGVDYDLWLGPAPQRAFNPNRLHWNYVYYWDYAGGMMSGWGVHHTDIIHWAMKATAPLSATAVGGTYVLKDSRETPDTLDAFFEYPGFSVQGSMYHGNGRLIEGRDVGVAFYGSQATLIINRTNYELWPENDPKAAVTVPGVAGDGPHAKAFVDAITTRKMTVADIAEGHRSTVPVLLANIAFRTGRKLTWDAKAETLTGDAAARKYLSREYRKPWVLPG